MDVVNKTKVTAEAKITRKDGTVEILDVELDEESIQQILAMSEKEQANADRLD